MVYSLNDPEAAERHETQYFEMFGNRGIYHKGWSAVTNHRIPWDVHAAGVPFDQDIWELYDGTSDWTQAHDLAAEQPEKLAALQRLFLIEAAKHNVLPLDDRLVERVNPELAGRPQLIQGTSQVLFPGMRSLTENCMLNIKNKSHSITAELVVPEGDARGGPHQPGGHHRRLGPVRQGRPPGLPLQLPRHPAHHHRRRPAPARRAAPGADGVRLRRRRARQRRHRHPLCRRRPGRLGGVERTHALNYSLDETTDVGQDTGAPVCDDYPAGDNTFTGAITWIRLDIGADSHDHLLDPAQLLHFAMTRQ